jgi:membrane associated rhomboid family serine protease
MSARRWPIVTLALILVNLVIFAGTHRLVDQQDSQLWKVEDHILILAATHPNLVLAPDARAFVTGVQSQFPDEWAEMQNPSSDAIDDWHARIRQIDDPAELQAEMDSLGAQYSQLTASSITERYAFEPANPKPITYLTSTFLHADWWHVLGNMWFLWLAGFVLEDAWGRPLYLLVYLVAGAMACQFDVWANPGSIVHSVGASGAVAGLMGAFLVGFPKMRIRMMWLFDLGLFPYFRFWMRAYWLLPLWVLIEINSGMGPRDGIGHWAHVGGFLFGALAAVALRYSGLEHKVHRAIEQKVSWSPEAEIVQANDMMESGKLNEADEVLNQFLSTNNDSFAAWSLLRAVYWRASNIPAYREATIKLCELQLKAREPEAAWQEYEDFLNAGGEYVPPTVWLELCRVAEERQDFERAVSEYVKLADTHDSKREAVLAKISAARLCLKRLNRPQDALRLYEGASASTVPHLELERDIQMGIRQAEDVLSPAKSLSSRATSAS